MVKSQEYYLDCQPTYDIDFSQNINYDCSSYASKPKCKKNTGCSWASGRCLKKTQTLDGGMCYGEIPSVSKYSIDKCYNSNGEAYTSFIEENKDDINNLINDDDNTNITKTNVIKRLLLTLGIILIIVSIVGCVTLVVLLKEIDKKATAAGVGCALFLAGGITSILKSKRLTNNRYLKYNKHRKRNNKLSSYIIPEYIKQIKKDKSERKCNKYVLPGIVRERHDARKDGMKERHDARKDGRKERHDAKKDGTKERHDARKDGRKERHDAKKDGRKERHDAKKDGNQKRNQVKKISLITFGSIFIIVGLVYSYMDFENWTAKRYGGPTVTGIISIIGLGMLIGGATLK